jgi:hypothetical protein
MAFVENFLSPVLTGTLLFGFLTWIGFMCYWFLKYLGVGKIFTQMRLNRKFKNGFKFDDEIIKFCTKAIQNGWKYRDIKRFAKVNLRRDEILHTYFLLKKMNKIARNTKEEKILKDFGGMIK